MLQIHLLANEDTFDAARRVVEAGAADVPCEIYRSGRLSITAGSLHKLALTTVAENPTPRLIAWTPHHHAKVGPRIQALLDRRAAVRAEARAKKQGASA